MKGNTTKMYWERYIDRRNPRRIEPLDKPIDTYIMLDTETTGLHPEEGATLIEIGALFVQPGNENSRPKFEQLIDPQHPLTEFITGLTGITDRMLQGMPTAGAAMMRFHQWIDHVWPAGEPLTIIAHNAQFDVSFLDVAERVYDPTSPVFDCKWACTKEMSWELNPQKRHHRVADLIVDYHIGDVEEHRALSDAIQEQNVAGSNPVSPTGALGNIRFSRAYFFRRKQSAYKCIQTPRYLHARFTRVRARGGLRSRRPRRPIVPARAPCRCSM